MRLRQKFEYSLFPRQYDNKTFILSAKIKSNSQNARLNVYAGGYLAVSGTTYHSGSGQYETLTAIFTTPATITTEFSVHIGIDGVNSANTAISNGDYFEVKEVQLEVGKVATPFEHRSYGEELALCQRYYYLHAEGGNDFVGMGDFYEADQVDVGIQFPVTMRAIPTLDQVNGTNYYIVYTAGVAIYVSAAWILFRPSPTAATLFATPAVNGTAGNAARIVTNSSGSYIAFKAEL